MRKSTTAHIPRNSNEPIVPTRKATIANNKKNALITDRSRAPRFCVRNTRSFVSSESRLDFPKCWALGMKLVLNAGIMKQIQLPAGGAGQGNGRACLKKTGTIGINLAFGLRPNLTSRRIGARTAILRLHFIPLHRLVYGSGLEKIPC